MIPPSHLAIGCVMVSTQYLRVVVQVVGHEGGDEVVAVVVAGMPAQVQCLAGLGAGQLEQMRVQLHRQKLVGQALVDQDAARDRVRCAARPSGRVASCAAQAAAVGAQVAGEGLASPRALAGRADRRKSRDRLEQPGVAQRQRQRAVTAHRVAEDADAGRRIRGRVRVSSGSSSAVR